MWKVHGIDVVLPRVLQIEEEEHATSGRSNGVTWFNKYEHTISLKWFLDPEVKYK